ncbi:MAG: ParD-like family protein [Thiocapsa sp.]|jgi:hypothetical protein|nr:ParD-like family protein [Thiocapsa sp.]MCG6897427.1 ParD-like family protein [Thiocapsa sp.]MCG6984239.1 ParD-like family protein [Thiocapsa sp.]
MGNPSSDTISVHIPRDLYEQARSDAASQHRTIPGQIEYWAKVGRAALDNPDLPVTFVAEASASLAEPREQATPFEPRGQRQ